MRVASWNVNSIRARLERVVAFLDRHQVDALAMQEIKCRPDQFPTAAFEKAGYQVLVAGQSRYNGVAVASRVGLHEVAFSLPEAPTFGDPATVEARALGVRCAGIELWSLYVPHGRALDHPHFAYKLQWLAALEKQIKTSLALDSGQLALYVGDFNIAPQDEDVWDMAAFAGLTHVSAPERAAWERLLAAGVTEVSRPFAPGWTYWDYQRLRFQRDQGMKIDFALATPALATQVKGAFVDREERKGQGASDHAPLVIDF